MSYSTESFNFEFEPLQSTTVALPASAVNWAVQVCQQELEPAHLWSTFLRALALKGLQQWLKASAQDIAICYETSQPPSSSITCRVNDFRLCLIAQGSLSDEVVDIPQSTLDDAASFAHFYILAEVQEEANQVTILSGLCCARLRLYRHQAGLVTKADGTYALPVKCFDISARDVLLYLNYLNPEQLRGLATLGRYANT